jgi:hypothetical protein
VPGSAQASGGVMHRQGGLGGSGVSMLHRRDSGFLAGGNYGQHPAIWAEVKVHIYHFLDFQNLFLAH